jgi:hypothetical protein
MSSLPAVLVLEMYAKLQEQLDGKRYGVHVLNLLIIYVLVRYRLCNGSFQKTCKPPEKRRLTISPWGRGA